MPNPTLNALRVFSLISAIFGLVVFIVSAVLLDQSLDYRSELDSIFGYSPSDTSGNGRSGTHNYYSNALTNRDSYSTLGYEVDPPIGISAFALVVGLIQFLAAGLLCFPKKIFIMGWIGIQFALLLCTTICFALGIQYEIYSTKVLPSAYGSFGHRGPTRDARPAYLSPFEYQRNSNSRNPANDTVCSTTGQGFVIILGLDALAVLILLIVFGYFWRHQNNSDNSIAITMTSAAEDKVKGEIGKKDSTLKQKNEGKSQGEDLRKNSSSNGA